jgi:signal transduction histidine kinase
MLFAGASRDAQSRSLLALPTPPSRRLRQRLLFVERFTACCGPRHGLEGHVDVLLRQLTSHFDCDAAVLGLLGPEPRVFRHEAGGRTCRLDENECSQWRDRRAALPDAAGCISSASDADRLIAVPLDGHSGAAFPYDPEAGRALRALAPATLALPLMSYGKPLGQLCLMRRLPPFTVSDMLWLDDTMREVLPLLERSDLLEQLQRETAASERERIGRDLHDSAVQPYLGLKYGLEAISRQMTPNNPARAQVDQLLELTTQELKTLRDIVGGLRNGGGNDDTMPFEAALHRQAERFEALYGLRMQVVVPRSLHLRGAIARGVLHMINEGLTNVRRHTPAASVAVTLDVDDDDLTLAIRNDHGANPTGPVKEFRPRSLAERAREFGGVLYVARERDHTEVLIALPKSGTLG